MEFLRLTSDRDELFEAAFGLYETSFPVHEQRPPDKQCALVVMTHPRQISTSEYGRFARDLDTVVMADVP